MNSVTDFITNNYGTIIYDTIFAFLGVVLGIIFTPKDANPLRNNQTSKQDTVLIVKEKETIIIKEKQNQNPTNHSESDSLFLIVFFTIGAACFYARHQQLIMDIFTAFMLLALASIITIAIKLNYNNNYDRLNKMWTVFMLAIIVFDLTIIVLISHQDLILTETLSDISKAISYLTGLFFAVVPNIILLFILMHLFALNSYLSKQGRIASWILKKTSYFIKYPVRLFCLTMAFCVIASIFSSGIAYNLLQR